MFIIQNIVIRNIKKNIFQMVYSIHVSYTLKTVWDFG